MITEFKRLLHKHTKTFVLSIFIILAFLSIVLLGWSHTIFYNTDYIPHLAKMYAIDNNLSQGRFPLISWGATVPYGQFLGFSSWLTLLPFALLGFIIHDPVDLFYIIIFLITLLTYLVSYRSYNVYDKSLGHDLAFAILYTSSSIFYNWAIRSGNVSVLLAMAFLPMVWIGFLEVIRRHSHWVMLLIGLLLVAYSHLITAGLITVIIVVLSICNLRKLRLKGISEIILDAIIFIISSTPLWLPLLKLTKGIVIPSANSALGMYTGFVNWIGQPFNYLYGLIDLVGLISIIKVKSKEFKLIDFEIWLLSVVLLLFNAFPIARFIVSLVPSIMFIQAFYHFGVISHLLLVFLATKWITGKYTKNSNLTNILLCIIVFLALFTPIYNEINTYLLLNHRPTLTTINLGKPDSMYGNTPYKFNQKTFQDIKHRNLGYDYLPKTAMYYKFFDDRFKGEIYNKHNNLIANQRYYCNKKGIRIKNSKQGNSIQLPIVLYKHFDYKFVVNHHILINKNINITLTHKTHELVVHNLKGRFLFIQLKSVHL